MRRWASVLIRGVVQETPAPRRPACPARESGTAVPDKRTKAVPGDEPRDHPPPRSITFMKPSRIYVDASPVHARLSSFLGSQGIFPFSTLYIASRLLRTSFSFSLSVSRNFEPIFLRYFSRRSYRRKEG